MAACWAAIFFCVRPAGRTHLGVKVAISKEGGFQFYGTPKEVDIWPWFVQPGIFLLTENAFKYIIGNDNIKKPNNLMNERLVTGRGELNIGVRVYDTSRTPHKKVRSYRSSG